jgi:hypothetical protein
VDADAQEGTRPEVEDAVEEAGGTDASTVVELTQALMRQMVALAGAVADSSGLNPSDLAALRALDAAQAPAGRGQPAWSCTGLVLRRRDGPS